MIEVILSPGLIPNDFIDVSTMADGIIPFVFVHHLSMSKNRDRAKTVRTLPLVFRVTKGTAGPLQARGPRLEPIRESGTAYTGKEGNY